MKNKPFTVFAVIAASLLAVSVHAQSPQDTQPTDAEVMQQIEASLPYKTGDITIDDVAVIKLPQGYKYLQGEDAYKVITEMWGQEIKRDDIDAIIVADGDMLVDDADPAVMVNYEDGGYVSDSDAQDIDPDEILKNWRSTDKEDHTKTLDWLIKPVYDNQTHTFTYASQFEILGYNDVVVGKSVNYSLYSFNRHGSIILTGTGTAEIFDRTNKITTTVADGIEYLPGHDYSSYTKGDKISDMTIGGIAAGGIVGAVLAKTGILAVVLKFIKVIAVAVIAIVAGFWKRIRGKKEEVKTEEVADSASTEN